MTACFSLVIMGLSRPCLVQTLDGSECFSHLVRVLAEGVEGFHSRLEAKIDYCNLFAEALG